MTIMNVQLTKDQVQKIILSVMLLIFTIYCYFQFLLTPLQGRASRAVAESEGLEKKIAETTTKIRELNKLKEEAIGAGELIAQANAFIPEGSPIAWFPPRMKEFFELRQGLKNVRISQRAVEVPKDAGFKQKFVNGVWGVEIPSAEYFPLGIALMGLENEEYLVEITSLNISGRDVNAPETTQVSLELLTLLKDTNQSR